MSNEPVLPLGYSLNNGGLNNQRLALLGLFEEAVKAQRPLVLPYLYDKDVAREENKPDVLEGSNLKLYDVFDEARLQMLFSRWSITISATDPAELPMGGWEYFGKGAACARDFALGVGENYRRDLVRDFFRLVVPNIRNSNLIKELDAKIFHRDLIYGECSLTDCAVAAVQFRIESDWKFHSAVTLMPTIGFIEQYNIGFFKILRKVKNSLPGLTRVLAIYDEQATEIDKEEARYIAKKDLGLTVVWKSDFIDQALVKELGPLRLSLIDFELAISASSFVGLSRSTFSNLVSINKAAFGMRSGGDYIYNNFDDAYLSKRTDNGAHADPEAATITTPVC